jgi:hypothetical protein
VQYSIRAERRIFNYWVNVEWSCQLWVNFNYKP